MVNTHYKLGGSGGRGGDVQLQSNASIFANANPGVGIYGASRGGDAGSGQDPHPGGGYDPTVTYGAAGTGGAVTVALENNIGIFTAFTFSPGIVAQSLGGNPATWQGAWGSGGQVTVTTSSNSMIDTEYDYSHAIFAQSIGGFKGANGFGAGLVGYGGDTQSLGDGGPVTVTNYGTLRTITIDGNVQNGYRGAVGILAQSIGGGGGLLTSTGLAGSAGGAGSGGAVVVNQYGTIATRGAQGHGIFAQSAGGTGSGGPVTVTVSGSIGTSGNNSYNLAATSTGQAGSGPISLTVTETGSLIGSGDGTAAIYLSGGNNNTITNRGFINSSGELVEGIFNSFINTGTIYSGSLTINAGAFTQNAGPAGSPSQTTISQALGLGTTAGSNAAVNLNGGALTAANAAVGSGGSATFNQTGGTLSVSNALTLGNQSGAGQASFNLSGGSASVNTFQLQGTGVINHTGGNFDFVTFTQNGSSASFADLHLGRNVGDASTYNLNGGTLNAQEIYVGDQGSGIFTQTGGVTAPQTCYVGYQGAGSLALSANGSFTAAKTYVGYNGTGTFSQTGGSLNISDTLFLGNPAGSGSQQGQFTLGGGNCTIATLQVDASGTFTQTEGTGAISTINLNRGGSYSQTGGTGALTTVKLTSGGTFNQTGGTTSISTFDQQGGTASFANFSMGNSLPVTPNSFTYNLANGSLTTTQGTIGSQNNAVFTQTGGTHANNDFSVLSNGTYDFRDGTFTVANFTNRGTFKQSGGTFDFTGFTQPGGTSTFSTFNLGLASGKVSTFRLQGGTLTAQSSFIANNGTLNQNGGAFTSNNVTLGGTSGSSTLQPAFNLTGGSCQATQFTLTNGGTLTQTGGVLSATTLTQVNGAAALANLYVADPVDIRSQGLIAKTYNLLGGQLASTNLAVGPQSTGTLNQMSGTLTIANLFSLGNSANSSSQQGLFNLKNGVCQADQVQLEAGGKVNQTGGTFDFSAFNQQGGTGSFTTLTLGRLSASSSTYTLNSGQLNAQNSLIGDQGQGTFVQTGGAFTVTNTLTLSHQSGSNGSYSLQGGTLTVNNLAFNYGGSFTQSAGSHTSTVMTLGSLDPSLQGTYNFQAGALKVGTFNLAARGMFTQGNGTFDFTAFNQTGGQATFTDLALGRNGPDSSTYTLSDGAISSNTCTVGNAGYGSFIQNAGTFNITDVLFLAKEENAGSKGDYQLNGGTLAVPNIALVNGSLRQQGGNFYFNNFDQSGGQATYTDLYVGQTGSSIGSSGTYNFNSGSVTANNLAIGTNNTNGTLMQLNGSLTVNNTLTLGTPNKQFAGSALYILTGGTSTVQTFTMNSGTMAQTGGTFNVTTFNQYGGDAQFNALILGHNTGNACTYNQSGGVLTIDTFTLNPTGTFNQAGGTLSYSSLVNNGVYNGNLTTAGTVTGSGTINGNVTNTGTVNPGNSPGTLTINGSYTQSPNGQGVCEIASATVYDRLVVTGAPGTVTLAGAITPTLYGGFRPRGNQVFPGVVTATGGVTGTFSHVSQPLTLNWQPSYNANSVDVQFRSNYANPALGLSANGQAVGAMLNGLSDSGPTGDVGAVLNSIDRLSNNTAIAEAYKEISPEKSVALSNLALTGASFQMRHQAQRLTDLRFADRAAALGGGGLAGVNPFGSSQFSGLMLAFDSPSMSGLITRDQPAASPAPWGVYLYPAMVIGSQRSTANQTGYTYTMAGFTLGADYRIRDNLIVGLATGYSYTNANYSGSGGSVQNNTWPVTAYAAYLEQSFYAYGSLGYVLNLFNQQRGIQFGGLKRTADSSPAGNQLNFYAEAGYDLKAQPVILTPVASLACSSLWLNGYSETGAGALNLDVASQNATSVQTGVGLKIAAPFKQGRATIIPQVYATYQHEFANNSRGLDASLSQGGTSFTFTADAPQRDFALVGAKVDLLTSKNFQVSLNYNAEVGRSNSFAQSIYTGLRWQF